MTRTFDLRALAVALGALVVLASSGAMADEVAPPPSSCPPGSTPRSSHAGPLCVPSAECTSATACTGDTACVSVSQCIETRDCGGLRPIESGPCTVETVVGECESGGTCDVGVCRARRVCASDAPSSGCSCRAPGAPNGSLPILVMIVGLALYARARRRRRM